MGMLKYDNYESIIDTIFMAGNIALKFHVALHYKDKNNKRKSSHGEYSYNTNRYGNDDQNVISVYRNISCYLTIENIRKTEYYDKESIMVLVQDVYYLRSRMNDINKILSNAYQRNSNGNLELGKVFEPVKIVLNGKTIEVIPIIINNENIPGGTQGIRITLNSYENYSDITIDQFMGLKYIIDTFDMYGYAITILNYIKPEKGTNNFNRDSKSPFK